MGTMKALRAYSFIVARAFRCCGRFAVALTIVLILPRLSAQEAPPPNVVTLRGSVVDAQSRPMAEATVKLQPVESRLANQADARETTTDLHGGFSFERLPIGDYLVVARKSGEQSPRVKWHGDSRNMVAISLVLRISDRPASAGIEDEGMAFSDQPHFAVAGVTDWTAAGGHGSDVTLRASESLNSATASLESKNNAALPGTINKEADAYRLAGDLAEKRGEPLLAVQKFEHAATVDPSEQNEFAWASELLQHRAIWQAEEVYRRGATAYPMSLRMQAGLGAALFAGARYDDAALQFCKASDLDPADTGPYLLLGEIAVASPKALGCVEAKLGRFVQLHPEIAIANYFYAMSLLKDLPTDTARSEQAEGLLRTAVSLDPGCSKAYLELGILAAARRDNEQAIRYYLKAIETDPALADAHYRLGVAYDRAGDSAKAEQEFALHKQMEQRQAEATEKQRKTVKQFLFSKPDNPSVTAIK